MRNRTLIHRATLAAFQTFCEAEGWTIDPTKAAFQVLRMRHKDHREPMIVFERGPMRNGKPRQQLTVYGHSLQLAERFADHPRPEA